MTEALSPSAQAVLDVFLNGYICNPEFNVAFESDRNGLAAALRAVADQVVPQTPPLIYAGEYESGIWDANNDVRADLLAIAAELEGQMTERPSIDELISAMPISWRQRWCNNELCGCLGCANGSGRLIFYGYTQEDHQNWVNSHPNKLKL